MVRRCWVNFKCRGVLRIWIIVGQSVRLGGCLDIYSHLSFSSSVSLSLGDGPIETEILSQRAVKPQNNQPTNPYRNDLNNNNSSPVNYR